ncbi:unnamed protein product [Microthlaspi erraticum]|uniref:Uncharacterized protein n=1 Tax=Microthlaspi erraticum TaxID=1685480 RepID=A0A6D2JZD7_9BRAS|nr:unnamed protein product [Microthlaspi erraticum]
MSARYGLSLCPLTVKSPPEWFQITTAPYGFTSFILKGPDHRDLSLPGKRFDAGSVGFLFAEIGSTVHGIWSAVGVGRDVMFSVDRGPLPPGSDGAVVRSDRSWRRPSEANSLPVRPSAFGRLLTSLQYKRDIS